MSDQADAIETSDEQPQEAEQPVLTEEEQTLEQPEAPEQQDVPERALEPADSETSVSERLGVVIAQMDALTARVESIASGQERYQTVLHRLHEENQRLRRGEIREALMPMVTYMIDLVDQVERALEFADEQSVKHLTSLQRSVIEGLRRNGVEVREVELGAEFDPSVHMATGPIHTEVAEQDETVADVSKALFVHSDSGKVVRPAHVEVFRFVTPPAAQAVDQGDGSAAPEANNSGEGISR
jgi:molecular chaperone GrpE (heat shock protein)